MCGFYKFLFLLSVIFSSSLKAMEGTEFLKSFKLGSDDYTIEMRDGIYVYLKFGYVEYFYTEQAPESVALQQDNLTVMQVVDYKNKLCPYGYYIIEHRGRYPMMSEFLSTCVKPEYDAVFIDAERALHIEVKSGHAVSVANVLYKNGKVVKSMVE